MGCSVRGIVVGGGVVGPTQNNQNQKLILFIVSYWFVLLTSGNICIKVMLHGTIFNDEFLTQHCCVKNRRRVTWRAGRFLTQHFVAATCCSNLKSIQIAATLLPERCRNWFV